MIVPPPLLELAAAELRLVADRHAPGRHAVAWKEFGRGARSVIGPHPPAEVATTPVRVLRPAVEAVEAPRRRRRGPTSAKARQRQKIKQHNRRLAKRNSSTA